MMLRTCRRLCLIAASVLLAAPALRAQELSGVKQVVLSNAQGERVVIGNVRFEPAGDGRWRFDLQLDPQRFEERFLAMRPFKCLTGVKQQLCHFPYGTERMISRDDLVPLEYALMFLHKRPADVNVNSANGVYYKLRWNGSPPVGFRGELYDVDMDPIIVPEGDRQRPIRAEDLLRGDEGSHWLPHLSIE